MTKLDEHYPEPYFQDFADSSRRSAAAIVPKIMEWVAPASVIDYGCGVGGWLAEFQAAGVRDILGVDGRWVQDAQLAIPAECFVPHDLTAAPFLPPRRFDLAMTVEAAEHLAPEAAKPLWDLYARLEKGGVQF